MRRRESHIAFAAWSTLGSMLSWLLATSALAQAPTLDFLDVPARPHQPSRAPSADAVRGLAELEGELERFGRRIGDYRGTVEDLLQRRARERRRAVLARYASSLAHERRSEGRSRADAIRHLESFVRRHPNEPRHTPSALLRLADLYVERAYDAPGDGELDLDDAIQVGHTNLRSFPSSPHHERAAYLLGWALARSGRGREGVDVWRSVVCANLYQYPVAPSALEATPTGDHPALSGPEAPPVARETYGGCRPTTSPLTAEIWLRIGEQHFDAAELNAAVGAYRHVTEHPGDRLFTFGLYKLAWSQYRAGRYAEAIEHFSQVVLADTQLRRSGQTRTSLREEALEYIALTLAYDDWNEDGRADHTQGGPHPLERLEDANLWPQDRAWSPEIYRRVGDALFEQALPDEAILAWRLRLTSYPPACDTPDTYLSIVRAQRQLGDEDAALATLTELADRVGPSASWGSRACPGRAARAEELSRSALASTARIRHRRAQRLRERATLDDDDVAKRAAMAEYAVVVEAYRHYLATYPNNREAYEIAYDLADALYWSERYREAAQAYAEVRDSPLDGRRFAAAARRVVESERRLLEATGADSTPLRESISSTPAAVPSGLQRLARAREIYVQWVRPHEDVEHVRDAYAFNNARLASLYGFGDEARRRWSALFVERCRGPHASAIGAEAFQALLDDAIRRRDTAAIQRLGRDVRERRCSFSASGPALLEGPCGDASGLCRELPRIEISGQLRDLQDQALALGQIRSGPERARRASWIARQLISTIDRARAHPDAPAALLLAARLLEQETRRSAVQIYQRIVDEVQPAPESGANVAGHADVENVVAEAHFQLGRARERAFDYERALASYATIIDSPRFQRSADPRMRQRRRDAMVNAALLISRLGRHEDAARAWTQTAEILPPIEARDALFRAAEATLASGDAARAGRLLDAWLRSGEPTVAAHALRARAAAERGDARRQNEALRAALAHYRAHPRRADVAAAAEAALALADAARDALPDGRIAPGRRATLDAYMAELGRQIQQRSALVRPVVDAYSRAVDIGHARRSVAALHHQGAIYEALVRTVLGARLELPRDVSRRLRRSSPAGREAAREQIQDALTTRLDEQVRPVECMAIERYALSVRLARRASLPTSEANASRTRLAAYGDERVAACIAAAHARDPSFAPFETNELRAARPGRHLTPPSPVGPRTLAP